MKYVLKIISCLLSISVVSSSGLMTSNQNKVSAATDGYVCSHGYHTLGDYVLASGVGNYGYNPQNYWLDDYIKSYGKFGTAVAKGIGDWKSSGGVTTPVDVTLTIDKSAGDFEFHSLYLGSNIAGDTHFYNYSQEVTLTSHHLTSNYGWVYINVNFPLMQSKNYDIYKMSAVVAHEFGHGMGLSHRNTVPTSIMCQLASGRTVDVPSASDCRTVVHLYG